MELILLVLLLAVGALFTLVIPTNHARDTNGVVGETLSGLGGFIRLEPHDFGLWETRTRVALSNKI
ncbi:hypothetical protein 2050H1_031 [Serratia phage 2050H1]|uniref:Uncharacterized protein n=1 Tax=Serratia phage 2050H1 TaxID=2024250 RepID=A0A249Y297_9CAUD|nr:hypothetical protein 2050H1_031 [Serratia phage 2050H1]